VEALPAVSRHVGDVDPAPELTSAPVKIAPLAVGAPSHKRPPPRPVARPPPQAELDENPRFDYKHFFPGFLGETPIHGRPQGKECLAMQPSPLPPAGVPEAARPT
jgi:hypothetical protein